MPTFEYQAQDGQGQSRRGVAFGESLEDAVSRLGRQGLSVQTIQATGAPAPAVSAPPAAIPAPVADTTDNRTYAQTSVWGPLVGQVPVKDLAFFFRQAATMLNAGVPYYQAMSTLAAQARNPKLREVLQELAQHVHEGRPISFGMQRYPEVFSSVVLSLVRAGEEGGFLDQALGQVADYLEREIELRNLYRRITIYPKLQLAASVIIIVGANAIIGSVNPNAGQLSSPLTTPSTWIVLGPLLIALFLFFRVGLANPRVRYNWDAVLSHIPALGRNLQEVAMARFGRAFGALYKGGVPLSRCMQLGADACGNEYLRAKILAALPRLESGRSLTEVMRETGAFSPVVLDMVATGESTGNLDQMLGKMADYYEAEAATKAVQTAYIVGVLIGLLVAIYIGYIVISFYSGYFSGLSRELG